MLPLRCCAFTVEMCLSVHLSDMIQYHVKMAQLIIVITNILPLRWSLLWFLLQLLPRSQRLGEHLYSRLTVALLGLLVYECNVNNDQQMSWVCTDDEASLALGTQLQFTVLQLSLLLFCFVFCRVFLLFLSCDDFICHHTCTAVSNMCEAVLNAVQFCLLVHLRELCASVLGCFGPCFAKSLVIIYTVFRKNTRLHFLLYLSE